MWVSARAGCVVASLALLAACGGGGGSDQVAPAPPPCEPVGKVCYVSPAGRNTNTGATPQAPLQTISKAAQIALSDYAIVVAPGTYIGEVTTTPIGKAPQRLHFVAQGRVVVDVSGIPGAAGFTLANSPGTIIDGFMIRGGADGGIVLKSHSDDFEIRNCVVSGSAGDGIRVQDSAKVLVFNNLVFGNTGIGMRIGGTTSGSANAQLINNTVYGNGARGIEIGNTSAASPGAFVFNNIVESNGQENIKVDTNLRSDLGYNGDHNLVFPGSYLPGGAGGIRGANDINSDALFLASQNGDFHLSPNSPAINRGDALQPEMADLRRVLGARTTTGVDRDLPPLDIGYHYPL
jgi:parallel beta-helix repeat protein